GVATVMTGHLRVPALDPSGTPATFSAPILTYLRDALGFRGLIVTDALMMGAAVKDAASNPSVRALAAGCDVLCYPADPQEAHDAITDAMATAALPEARVEEALVRYGEALLRAHSPHPPTPSPASGEGGRITTSAGVPPLQFLERGTGGEADAIGDRLLSLGMVRGKAPRLKAPIELIIIDDDQGGAWPASPNDYVERALRGAGVPLGPGGSRVVLAFAEPRASKGRAGFGPASLDAFRKSTGAAAVIVFGHPRLAAEVPGDAPLLVAWHRQRLMQEAAARWLVGRIG
ncbi:MAG TPA: glycoside hydrolase family 3 N-terminal domain-containing protein, partial [Gemmatimonadales bacterium]|nr:glycoside hydrolase family 3 N-terminal domain-containing protein [Gemmatimonadales bacterium]